MGIVGLGIADVPKNRNGHRHFRRTYWLNHTTQIESYEDSDNYTLNVPENAWFNDALKGKNSRWSKPYYEGSLQEFILSYSVPVYDRAQRNIIAVLVIDFDLQIIDRQVSQNIGQKYTSIIDKNDGTYIYADDTDKVLNHISLKNATDDLLGQNTYQQIRNNPCNQVCSFSVLSGLDKELILYQSLQKLPWLIVAKYNNQQLSSLNRTTKNSLGSVNFFV